MSRVISFFRSLLSSQPSAVISQSLTPFRDFSRFAEGDRVLINGVKLLEPLKRGKTTDWKHAIIHDSIIGKSAGRLKISSPKGASLTVEQPSFDQFVSLSPRHVTPIYAQYASFIVSQLDIHVTPPSSSSSPTLEILEAGTGHGSLTLHLARAIAAANPPPPDIEYPRMAQTNLATTVTKDTARMAETWAQWKEKRSAVVHTVEFSEVHSRAAERLIRSFRQGLYWPHIDFNIGDVGAWATAVLEKRRAPFLSAAILDVPDVQTQLAQTLPAMLDDAKLVVFAASITQLCECEKLIDEQKLPLLQEKVLELGQGISDGRLWNVKVTVPRARRKEVGSQISTASDSSDNGNPSETYDTSPTTANKVMICRPKVGERTIGGGFIGIWRKVSASTASVSTSASG